MASQNSGYGFEKSQLEQDKAGHELPCIMGLESKISKQQTFNKK